MALVFMARNEIHINFVCTAVFSVWTVGVEVVINEDSREQKQKAK